MFNSIDTGVVRYIDFGWNRCGIGIMVDGFVMAIALLVFAC